ncbi:beta-N-acetylhexosaminidase [Aquisalimonas sp. 2447]|uniref:beta-N-acetylhexosaminidase n=1 Tax=Aquisalimonas sp. 2447 TaxID=2740807 RepID=UPI0014326AD6|nr:beta-N-acetylhexosaminidase [Aquisalimonas sp. 2447]QIT55722.1 beta-N-acetylhexosaminidase [Aquisalimonas sp. 2447]
MTPGGLMIGLQGPELTADERELLQHPRVAGAILFQRNIGEWEQLRALVGDIRSLSTPGLVAVDQEGGRVQRIGAPCTRLPPVRRLGEWHDRDPAAAEAGAGQLGWLMSAELRTAGIDLSFAPVLDLDRGISAVIGDRAFHGDPDAVAALGGAWSRGMRAAGMASCGKHFPGHGAVTADSHTDLPVDHRPELELRGADMAVFERLIDEDALTAIMTAHVVYPHVDNQPATFSPTWIHRTLREEMNFRGVVVGDDLGMEAAASVGDLVARAESAVHAGCDLVMLCNELDGIGKVLDALGAEVPDVTAERLQRLRGGTPAAPDLAALQEHPDWRRARELAESFD